MKSWDYLHERPANYVRLIGKLVSPFEKGNCLLGQNLYEAVIQVSRLSGTLDNIHLVASEEQVRYMSPFAYQQKIAVEGFIVAGFIICDQHFVGVYITSQISTVPDAFEDENRVYIDGYICQKPKHRITAARRICSFKIATERENGLYSYVPTIAWERTADNMAFLENGTPVTVKGRLQSRIYKKNFGTDEEPNVIEREVYELSVSEVRYYLDRNEVYI